MSQSKKRRKSENCPNCGAELPSPHNFCQLCGQENHDLKVPFSHLVGEVIEGFFHLDTKLVETIKVMLIRPGQITKDFVEGRRARYVPPIRLYFFVSFVFFLLANYLSDKAFENGEESNDFVNINVEGKDVVGKQKKNWDLNKEFKKMGGFGLVKKDSLKNVIEKLPSDEQQTAFNKFWHKVAIDSLKKYDGHPAVGLQRKIEDSFDPKNKDDAPVFANLKEPLLKNWRVSTTLDNREELGYFNQFGKDSDAQDSLQRYYEAFPYSKAKLLLIQLKTQIVEDSLKKYHGKLPVVLLGKVIASTDFGDKSDSLWLDKMEVNQVDIKTFQDTARLSNFNAFEDIKLAYSKEDFRIMKQYSSFQLDSFLTARLPSYRTGGGFKKWFFFHSLRQILRLNSENDSMNFGKSDERTGILKQMTHAILQWSSVVMFIFMPLVAFLLLLIFYRLKRFYYEHLIFSVHIHSVLFFLLSIGFACQLWLNWKSSTIWMMLAFFVYIIIALRKVYGQGWFKTIFKFFMLSFVYLFMAILCFFFVAVYGFLTF